MNETWRSVVGCDGTYAVSSLGRVRGARGAILKQAQNSRGYCIVCVGKTRRVHRLVAEAFIPNPQGLLQINHKNFDKQDNRVENLEWCTSLHNVQHAQQAGRYSPYFRQSGKLSPAQVQDMRIARRDKFSLSVVAEYFKVHVSTVKAITDSMAWKAPPSTARIVDLGFYDALHRLRQARRCGPHGPTGPRTPRPAHKELITAWEEGLTLAEIAARFNISPSLAFTITRALPARPHPRPRSRPHPKINLMDCLSTWVDTPAP